MANIKKGYNAHFLTWENDADNGNTVVKAFETYEEVRLAKKVSELFRSISTRADVGKIFGNADWGHDIDVKIIERVHELLQNEKDIQYMFESRLVDLSPSLIKHWELFIISSDIHADFDLINEAYPNDTDILMEAVTHLLFVPDLWCEGEKYRVCDSCRVYYIKENIPEIQF